MKTSIFYIAIPLTFITFICSYFMELTASNLEQYLAIALVVFADGFFGIIGGIKREGFKTYKSLKILKTLIFWVIMITVILSIEKGLQFLNILSRIYTLHVAHQRRWRTSETLRELLSKIRPSS